MAATRTNSPETSSMGRLFDAVSSILGVRDIVNYEGQAAIELEGIADRHCAQGYEFGISMGDAGDVIDTRNVIRRAVADMLDGVPAAIVSARFHLSVARLIAAIAENVRSERRLNRVVLSGGVFQNLFLLERTCEMLRTKGFQVITHSRVPTNDGGISLGQAAVANALIKSGRI